MPRQPPLWSTWSSNSNSVPDLQQELREAREAGAPARAIAALLELHKLDRLQSWRDHLALGEYLLQAGRPVQARDVLNQGLASLKGQPCTGPARRELKQLLARASAPRSASREAPVRRQARRAPRAAARAGSTTPVDAPARTPDPAPSSPAPAPSPAPALSRPQPAVSAPDARLALEEVPVRLRIEVASCPELAALLERGDANGPGQALARRRAALLGAEVAMADRFDHLLCLDTMREVERMPHQIETVRRVLRVLRGRALLADEVGLGKTIEAAMVLSEYLQRGLVRSVLILVPAALVGQWREELSRKFGIEAATTEDEIYRADPETFWSSQATIVASLEVARRRQHQPLLAGRTFDLVIVDEAHRLKRATTRGHQLVDSLRSRFLLLLTATPVENDLEELYNIITLLRPGQLETRAAFRRRFVSAGDKAMPRNANELRGRLAEVMVRNTRALIDLRLPPRFASTVRCEPTPHEQEIYDCVRELVASGYGSGRERLALGTLIQEAGSSPRAVAGTARKLLERPGLDAALDAPLRRIVNLCRVPLETAKSQRLLELLEHAQQAGDKVVVFTRYRETLALLEELLECRGLAHSTFSGAMDGAGKDAAVRALEHEVDVMLATEVGGEGRNLQCASTLVNFDLPWNPMRLEQRIGRLHRIGQKREVRIYNLCAAGSAEDRILEVLDRRINMFELVVGELDMILGQLEDERDFAERVLQIYGTAHAEEDVAAGFGRLGDELAAARERHERTKQLDQLLFGQDFEV